MGSMSKLPSPKPRQRNRAPTRTRLGEKFSEGSRLLTEAIAKFGSVTRASRATGLTTGTLVLWKFGDRTPDLASAIRLRDEFGVPVDAWLKPPSKAKREAA